MQHALITAVLAPVLLVQGRRVRRTALELPEAAGPREGVTGQGPPFSLLVLGDSAAAGVGIATQEEALTGCLVRALSTERTVHWRLVAHSGDRLSHILRAAEKAPPQAADLVVVSAGINDVLQGISPAKWTGLLHELARCFEQRFQARRVAFSGIPRIQEFTLLPQPLAWYLGLGARRLNRATRQALPGLLGAWQLVDLDLPLTADFLARDGFHPNEAASQLWSERVLASLPKPLRGRACVCRPCALGSRPAETP